MAGDITQHDILNALSPSPAGRQSSASLRGGSATQQLLSALGGAARPSWWPQIQAPVNMPPVQGQFHEFVAGWTNRT